MSKRAYSGIMFFTCIVLWIVNNAIVQKYYMFETTMTTVINILYVILCGLIGFFLYTKFVDKD